MISDFSVIWISISVIVLCWAVVRVNQKIDETIRNYKYNNALDGSTGSVEPNGLSGRTQAESQRS